MTDCGSNPFRTEISLQSTASRQAEAHVTSYPMEVLFPETDTEVHGVVVK
jgi:hypothetical protein